MDNFNEISWRDIGISIDDLNKTLENPETINKPIGVSRYDGLMKQAEDKPKLSNGRKVFWLVVTMLSVIVLLISSMVNNAHAGTTFMMFKVHSVSEDTIVVVDEHGQGFTFYKEGSPTVQIGQIVTVATDMIYQDHNVWTWDRKKTSIIDVMDE